MSTGEVHLDTTFSCEIWDSEIVHCNKAKQCHFISDNQLELVIPSVAVPCSVYPAVQGTYKDIKHQFETNQARTTELI